MPERRQRSRVRLQLEELESRITPTVYSVTSLGDNIARDGAVTLREAILAAETHRAVGDAPAGGSGANTIRFHIPGSGPHIIHLKSALPALTGHITIDGTSQPGYSGRPLIELDGSSAGSKTDGLTLNGGYNTVRGLLIDHFRGNGIVVSSDHNTIAGDFIGVDASGFFAAGNGKDGILIVGKDNIIGGTRTHDRVVIGGNRGAGVDLSGPKASNNLIEGDYIGTDADGFAATPNTYGILIQGGANHNQIGGTTRSARDVISGNSSDEIRMTGRGTSMNVVQGNFIGPDASGDAAALSGRDGIRLDGGASANQIGGSTSGSGNLIGGAGHQDLHTGRRIGFGIEIVGAATSNNVIEGNWIGVNAAGLAPLDNLAGGIVLHGAGRNTIGGHTKSARNMIADQTNSHGLGSTSQILSADWIIHSIDFIFHPGLRNGSFRV